MATYFDWLAKETPTTWWHDSANPDEIDRAKTMGAQGVTTNPVLTFKTFEAQPDYWAKGVNSVPEELEMGERAEALLNLVATDAAAKFRDVFDATGGRHGLALGQLNPGLAGSAEGMKAQAERIHSWAPNIAIKLPATAAGVEVVEYLAERAIPICATINVSVAQAIAVAEAYERGRKKALASGVSPALCLVVQQMGRLDDYIRDVAADMKADVTEEDITWCGTAMTKRTYGIFVERGYSSVIMPAGLRGSYHVTELAGADLTFSIHPRVQNMLLEDNPAREVLINRPIPADTLDRLMRIPEFVRAYEPDGLRHQEFITFGVTQKLLSQFMETGWARLETYGSSQVSGRWT